MLMMPIFNEKNQGRDATVDPAYLAHLKSSSSSSGEIEELQREVAQLQADVRRIQNQYNSISVQLDQTTGEVNSLSDQLEQMNQTITQLQSQINELSEIIESMDQYEPIEDSFIDDLPPYNSQEGEG